MAHPPMTGIGKGLVETYLSRPNHTLIAGVRDPNHPSSIILNDLPKGPGSSVVVVKIDSSTESDAAAAVKLLQSTYNITKVDVVIANAGIVKSYKSVATVSVAEVQEHIAVNAIGPLVLFQAVHPLLQNSARPKFVVVSSLGGSIGSMERVPLPLVAYGSSKALVNYFVRKIHFENESLIAFPIHPG